MYKTQNKFKQNVDFSGPIGQIIKVAIAVMIIALISVMAMSSPALAQSDEGDIKVDALEGTVDYKGNITLVDSSGSDVDKIKAGADGEVKYQDVSHGDYKLKTDYNGSTVESNLFTHKTDVTTVEFDVENNDLKVDSSTEFVKVTDPTDGENLVDFLQNPTLPVAIGMLIFIFVIVGMFLVAWRLYGVIGLRE